jgi:tRNA G26 N,N-dimethylase Trm1
LGKSTVNGPFWSGDLFDSTFVSRLAEEYTQACGNTNQADKDYVGKILDRLDTRCDIQNMPFGFNSKLVRRHLSELGPAPNKKLIEHLINTRKDACIFNEGFVKYDCNRGSVYGSLKV